MKRTILAPLFYEFHPRSERREHLTLGQTLVDMGALTEAQLQQALAEQNKSGRLLGDILLDRGFIDRRTRMLALARQHGMDFLDLDSTPSDPRAIEAIPERIARKNEMLPVHIEGDRVTVLIANPQIRHALKNVSVELGKRLHPTLTATDDIRKEIAARYSAFRSGKLQPVASKGAVDSFTIGLGHEVAGEGIRVAAIRPGLIDTEIHASGGEPDRAHRLAPMVPMKRVGTAEEIANAIVWLISDEASYVTSAILDVSGGR